MEDEKTLQRRRQLRLYYVTPVSCDIFDPVTKALRTRTFLTKNISSDGLYFESNEPLALQSEFNCRFSLSENSTLITAAIRVVRIEVISNKESTFGIGAFFSSIAEKDRNAIKELIDRTDINKLMQLAISKGASDLHLLANHAPVLRINGELVSLEETLQPEDIYKMIFSLMSKQQIATFERQKEMDFGKQFDSKNRFRVNVHQQKGFIEAALRVINSKTPTFEELGIPEVVKGLARQRDGLVLVVGPTGSGKTTTIAAMVELINNERTAITITLERPIEYVHISNKCIIKQREVGTDTNSFSAALKSSLRQDPNIIVIGELDDLETIKTALIAAEAGYLVIASFHAPDTIQGIDRLANMFPSENRKQALAQLSHCLKGVVAQMLLPRKDHQGRVLVTEVMVTNDAVKRIIRNDELIQLANIMQTGASLKMQFFPTALKLCYEQDVIDGVTYEWYSREISKATQ